MAVNPDPSTIQYSLNDPPVEAVLSALAETGWVVLRDLLGPLQIEALRELALSQYQQGKFCQAAIGHGAGQVNNASIRGDEICWLEQAAEK